MKVEMFYTLGCSACVATHDELRTAAQEVARDLEWRELNVVDNINRAVELGVLTVPSIAIDGEIVFTSMPSVRQFRRELTKRAARAG
jgi:hypothetical protein